jgi:NAD(P)-dependent dehydrogenase (short-subunit alcohol dehydrogenase family)
MADSKNGWAGKTVLVTGGSGGLGRAVAARYAAAGAVVAIADLAQEQADAAAAEIGRGTFGLACDVSKVAECEQMITTTTQRTGRLDLLVNAAGIWVEGDADQMTEMQWDRVIDVNLKGTFFASRFAIPALEKTGGQIINVGSDAGLVGNKGAAIYCASKGGVSLLTKALALELAPRGIRVNAVCPCDIETPMIEFQANTYGDGDPDGYKRSLLSKYPQGDLARFSRPEEIAAFIYAITLPEMAPVVGACLPIDFGLTAGY